MYDPDGDYQRDDGESTAATEHNASSFPSEWESFCFKCGCPLNRYNWTILLRGAFCIGCVHRDEQACFDCLELMPTTDTTQLCRVHDNNLWLSPQLWKHQLYPFAALAESLRFAKNGEAQRSRDALGHKYLTPSQIQHQIDALASIS